MKYEVKHDRYMDNRDGCGKLCNVFCKVCKTDILLYQKDGKKGGWLKRMYLDRIVAPEELKFKLNAILNVAEMESLVCPNCKTVLATPMEYIKPKRNENRLAYRCVAVSRDDNKTGVYPIKRRRKVIK